MKSTLKGLAGSVSSKNNVRAYRIAVTNRGSVYYKVVTFDGQYRGWIYGGKSTGNFGGGLTKYSTFNNQGMSVLTAAQQSATYKITTPGTANDGKSVTYKAPSWTQYKVGRAITDSTIYANTNFKIDQVGTRTRENNQWVHIYDPSNASSPAAGWILFSGLTQSQAVDQVADNAVRVNLVDASGKAVKSFDYSRANAQKGTALGISTDGKWSLDPTDQTSLLTKIQGALTGTNYGLDSLSTTQVSQLAQAKFGSSVNITVNPVATIADNAVRINLVKADNSVIKSLDWIRSGAAKGSAVSSLGSDEISKIQDLINGQLTNTGFALSDSKLAQTQIDEIAQGTFGGQVYVTVDPISTISSAIELYDGADETQGPEGAETLLSATTSEYSTTEADLQLTKKSDKISISSSLLKDQDPDAETSLIAQIGKLHGTTRNKAITSVNGALYRAAAHEYESTNLKTNVLEGKGGDKYTAGMVIDYLNGNNLSTLTSPKYLQIDNDLKTTDKTLTFYVVLGSIVGDQFGNAAKVYYEFTETKPANNTDTQ